MSNNNNSNNDNDVKTIKTLTLSLMTSKSHTSVIRTCRFMFDDGLRKEDVYVKNGLAVPSFMLTKIESVLFIVKFSPEHLGVLLAYWETRERTEK